MDKKNSLDDIGKTLELLSKMNHAAQDEAYPTINKMISSQFSLINRINYSINIPDIYISLPAFDTSQLIRAFELSTDITDQFKNTLDVIEKSIKIQFEPLFKQIGTYNQRIAADLTAFILASQQILQSGIFQSLLELFEFNEEAIDAFNDARWPIAPSMPRGLREHVVEMHRQGKTRYISRAIIGHYQRNNHKNLRKVIESWNDHPLFSHRMHIIRDALEAHCDGQFTLTVPTILPQIEGTLIDYVRKNNLPAKLGKIKEVYSAVIGDPGGYPLTTWAVADTLLYQLESNTYVYTKFEDELSRSIMNRQTTRHTVLHGISINYDKPIHSLKAFLLLDAISALDEYDPA